MLTKYISQRSSQQILQWFWETILACNAANSIVVTDGDERLEKVFRALWCYAWQSLLKWQTWEITWAYRASWRRQEVARKGCATDTLWCLMWSSRREVKGSGTTRVMVQPHHYRSGPRWRRTFRVQRVWRRWISPEHTKVRKWVVTGTYTSIFLIMTTVCLLVAFFTGTLIFPEMPHHAEVFSTKLVRSCCFMPIDLSSSMVHLNSLQNEWTDSAAGARAHTAGSKNAPRTEVAILWIHAHLSSNQVSGWCSFL